MRVLLYKKTGRNEICPCSQVVKKTIEGKDGKPVTFSTYAKGSKKFKNCHGRQPVNRKYVRVNDNIDLNKQRKAGRIGTIGL